MKKLLAILLVAIFGLTANVNAKGDKTNGAKTTEAVVSPAETKTTDGSLYWYEVSYDSEGNGSIPAGATLVAHAEQSNVNAPCQPGSTRDCLRGFTSPQTAATTNPGTAQIKTDDPE